MKILLYNENKDYIGSYDTNEIDNAIKKINIDNSTQKPIYFSRIVNDNGYAKHTPLQAIIT